MSWPCESCVLRVGDMADAEGRGLNPYRIFYPCVAGRSHRELEAYISERKEFFSMIVPASGKSIPAPSKGFKSS